MSSAILRLIPCVQDSPYGREGESSLAAQFGLATPEANFSPKPDQPYGEIWFGDHENGPSKLVSNGQTLLSEIEADPEGMLGKGVYERFGHDKHLPFLFKVLSFARALPLQAHPDRKLAEWLKKREHDEKGKNEQFVDPNHKPEVAVAITDGFEAFVGLRPTEEIVEFVRTVPELQDMVGKDAVDAFLGVAGTNDAEKMVKKVFGCLWEGDKDDLLKRSGESLVKRVKDEGDMALGKLGRRDNLGRVVTKVHEMYGDDIGLFGAPFFMNFIRVDKGAGIVVPANCLHAYLEGDVIECMARSDNMLSCGFQGALGPGDDPNLFVRSLLPTLGPASHLMLEHSASPHSETGQTTKYEVPLEEFDLLDLVLEHEQETISAIQGPSIWVVTSGEMSIKTGSQEERLKRGQVVYVKPGHEVTFNGSGEVWAAYIE